MILRPLTEVLKPGDSVEETPKIYLAGPIARLGVDQAARLHLEASVELVKRGYAVFSPLMNSYPIFEQTKQLVSKPWWQALEEPFIQTCDALVFIFTPELFFSEGCRREFEYAQAHRKPVGFGMKVDKGRWTFLVQDMN